MVTPGEASDPEGRDGQQARGKSNVTVEDRLEALLTRLDDPRQHSPDRWNASCPACGEPGALAITYNERGVGVLCHSGHDGSGCSPKEVVAAAGLTMAELFPTSKRGPAQSPRRRKKAKTKSKFRVLRIDYVDITGTIEGALILHQIEYWSGKRGGVNREGHHWVAKANAAWWDEIRVPPRTAQRAVRQLRKLGLIETREWMFAGKKINHFRVIHREVERLVEALEGSELT